MEKQKFLPYGKHNVTEEDINAVVEILKSDWLTQGPVVPEFEQALAAGRGALEAVSCSSGTAALHLAMLAMGIGEGDAVITASNTFVATANAAQFVGARVLFADIDPETGLIDPESVARLLDKDINHEIKAVIPVHFAGQPADLPALHKMARRHGARVIDDACHALGASYVHKDQTYRLGGSPHSDMTVFSFHPVKHVAMGEGGAVVTDNEAVAERLRLFRSHGIARCDFVNSDMAFSPDGIPNPWYYEMNELGFNYRLTDIQAALGLSQLRRLPQSLEKRLHLADIYRRLIAHTFGDDEVVPLKVRDDIEHAYHLFVVKIDFEKFGVSRAVLMNRLRAEGIGTQVHYIPVHLQPYYRHVSRIDPWDLQGTETYYARTLSLPMYPELTEEDIVRVIDELARALKGEYEAAPAGIDHRREKTVS